MTTEQGNAMPLKLLAAAICMFAGITCAQAATTKQFWYRFNNGAPGQPVGPVLDSSANKLNGAPSGSLVYSADVPTNGGRASLNAIADQDYVTVPDAPPLRPSGSFTITAWAKPTGDNNGADGYTVLVKKTGVQVGTCISSYGFYYLASSQKFSGYLCTSSNPGAPPVELDTTNNFPLGLWYKIQLSVSINAAKTATISLRVNGNLEAKKVIQNFPGIYYDNGPLLIGASNFASGPTDFYRRNFVGLIDEVVLTTPTP